MTMRRSDREITDFSQLVQVMEQCDVCRLALHDTPYPYILPLNFGMVTAGQQVTLYFHGAKTGQKYTLIEKDPHVSFEMDCHHQLVTDRAACKCAMAYESVIGQGVVQSVMGEEKLVGLTALMRHYHTEANFCFLPEVVAHTRVFKLVVHTMTGKRRRVN